MTEDEEQDERASERAAQARVYIERTQFFFRKYNELGLHDCIERVRSLALESPPLPWSISELGISDAAWDRVAQTGHSPLTYFCHPQVIVEEPHLITYYRGGALLSQKGAAYAGLHTEKQEAGRGALDTETAMVLAKLLNTHISELIEQRSLSPTELEGLAHVSLGAQIQGSWNNAIGAGATQNVKRLLFSHWWASGAIDSFEKKRAKKAVEPPTLDGVLESISDYYGVNFTNGSRVAFASEPDGSLFNPNGTLTGAVEIKGGTDPAGALERLGAAEKSFRAARAESPQNPCKTILLVAVITDEVMRRLQADPALFNSTYDLAELYVNDEKLGTLCREIDELLWLQS